MDFKFYILKWLNYFYVKTVLKLLEFKTLTGLILTHYKSQKGQHLLKLTNGSLSQVWPKVG